MGAAAFSRDGFSLGELAGYSLNELRIRRRDGEELIVAAARNSAGAPHWSGHSRYGFTVNPPGNTAVAPPGFVTRTSHVRTLGGPPALTVTVTVRLDGLELVTTAAGAGPEPPSKLTVTPAANPVPLIVAPTVEPEVAESGSIDVMLSEGGVEKPS